MIFKKFIWHVYHNLIVEVEVERGGLLGYKDLLTDGTWQKGSSLKNIEHGPFFKKEVAAVFLSVSLY